MTNLRPPDLSVETSQAPEVPGKAVAVSIAHDTIRELLVEALREEGYAVSEVAHGSAAETLARLKPDALLLEIGPWAEHVALLDTLRSDPQTSRTAVVTLTLAAEHQAAPESLDALSETKQRIRHHASLRFTDGLPIDACIREYHILGEIMWQHLLRSTPAEEVVAVLPKLMGLVDECVRIAVSEFNRLAVEDAQHAGVSRQLVAA